MGQLPKFWIVIAWCTVLSPTSINSQGHYYAKSSVNQYKIVNGRYQLVPPPARTTPEPTLLETIFPWMGDAYDSAKTPAEDAAILNSISDNEPASSNIVTVTDNGDNEGISSWFSLPGFGSSESESTLTPNVVEPPAVSPPGIFPSGNNMNYQNGPFIASPSQAQPIIISPPPPEITFGSYPAYPYPVPLPEQTLPQYAMQPLPNYIHHEIRNNIHPSQFHQQMNDAIPIPSMNPGYGQLMFPPYPYSASGNFYDPAGSVEATTEKPEESFFDMLSNYFSFGKRSDNFGGMYQNTARNLDEESGSVEEDVAEDDGDGGDAEKKEEEEGSEETPETKAISEFSCPKTGLWKWNGEICIAVGPVPVWACRPNDLIVSGKIAICRNKIYFSPQVLSRSTVQKT